MSKPKLLWNAFGVSLLVFSLACVFWGKEIFASPAGSSIRTSVHVLQLVFGLVLILFAAVMVRVAFQREEEKRFGVKAMLLCLAFAAFGLYVAFGTLDFIGHLRQFFVLLS